MSLILDALRKSEAERRQGHAPDVLAPMAHSRIAPPSQAAPGHWLAWLAVLLAIAIGAVVAWNRWMPNAPAVIDLPAPTAGVAPPAPRPAPTPTPTTEQVATPAPHVDREKKHKPSAATESVSVASAPTRTAKEPAVTPSSPSREQALPDAVPSAAERRPPSLAELDPGRRTNLPPLKLSMHVWADDPAHRFAIIDGHRVMEGAELSGILVREIRRDGVVLSIDGSDYWLPR